MTEVNKGRVGLLVAALRSGLYAKGPGTLHKYGETQGDQPFGGTWCCLGVAGDVARRFGLDITSAPEKHGIGMLCERIDGNAVYMGANVANWYGFSGENPVLAMASGRHIVASDWNDSDGTTFAEIADGFERTFLQD